MELEYSAPATGIVTTRIANRRVGSVMWCAFVTGLALSGLLVYLPLYTTKVLALSNAQYARLLALRMGGITVGVIVLGAISDRFGARRVTMICLAAGGALLACVGGASLGALLLLVPLISALLSTSFVNLNHLTQIADPSRQGRANTLYRAAGTLAGIVAPLIVTRFLGLGGWVMAAIGLLVASAAGVLASYPLHEPHRPIEGLVSEMRSLAGMYAAPLRSGGLMRFINLSILVTVLGASLDAFIAIRLTRQLGAGEVVFGSAASVAALITLAGILTMGAVLDRWPLRATLLWPYAVSAGCLIGIGLCDSIAMTVFFFVVDSIAGGISVAPMSMWIGNEARGHMTSAFAVQKVLSGLYLAVAMWFFAFIEPRVGIKNLFLVSGLLCLPVIGALALMREPPKSHLLIAEGTAATELAKI